MLITLTEEYKDGPNDVIIKTISSRRAGGRRELNTEPSRVRSNPISKLFSCERFFFSGHCRYERIQIYVTFIATCVKPTCDSCNSHYWGLYFDARNLC